MPIAFRCPNCSRKVSCSRKYCGTKGRCPHCRRKTIIPTPKRHPVAKPSANQVIAQNQGGIQTADAIAAALLQQVTGFAIDALGQTTLRRNIHNYNGATMAYVHQTDIANKLNLTPEQKRMITPFPDARGTTTNINVNQKPDVADEPPELLPAPSVWSYLWPWLLALAAAMAAAGLTWWALQKPSPPPAVNQPADDPAAEIGVEVE